MKWSDVADRLSDLKTIERDDILHKLGLEEHTPATDFATALGLFAVGVLVGAGLGLMFAPKAGADMRTHLGETLRRRGERMQGGDIEIVEAPVAKL